MDNCSKSRLYKKKFLDNAKAGHVEWINFAGIKESRTYEMYQTNLNEASILFINLLRSQLLMRSN